MLLHNLDAVILVGGKGTRLSSVIKDIPKPMAKLNDGRPFVDIIVTRLKKQGVRRIIMATGHLASHIHDFYKDDSRVVCIKEEEPLGTGGAIIHTIQNINDLSDPFFVLNGDSFYPFELQPFLNNNESALGAVQMENASRYGTITHDNDRFITGFAEKTGIETHGLVSAGVYKLNKNDLKEYPIKKLSIETDIFPDLVAQKRLKYVYNDGPMLDIGLPETYAIASDFIKDLDI